MFQASSAHLQEDTFVYKQHMVLSLCKYILQYFNILQQERPSTSLMYTQTPRLNSRHTLTQI